MNETKAILSIIRKNESSVLRLIAQKYDRQALFPQLNDQQFHLIKTFLKDQEKLQDVIVQALKLLVRYLVTLYHRLGEIPITEHNPYCEYLLFLLDAAFRHGLKIKQTLAGYTKTYWSMIGEVFYVPPEKPPLLGVSFTESFPSYFKERDGTKRVENHSTSTPPPVKASEYEKITANKKLTPNSSPLAWFMLLLNEKTLHQNISKLINSTILRGWYIPYAFIIQEQAFMFCDLLSALSSIDFAFQINEMSLETLLAKPETFIPEVDLLPWVIDIISDVETALEGTEDVPLQDEAHPSTNPPEEAAIPTELGNVPPVSSEMKVSYIDDGLNQNHPIQSSPRVNLSPIRESFTRSKSPEQRKENGDIEILKGVISQLELEVKALKRANFQSLAEVGKFKSLNESYETLVSSLKQDNVRLDAELQEERATRKDAESKFQELGSQLALVIKELSAARSQTVKFQKSSASSQGMLHHLQEQLHESQKTTVQLKEQLSAAFEQLALAQTEKEQLEREGAVREKLLNTISDEMAKSKLELKETLLERQLDPSRQKFVSRVDSKLVTNCTNCGVKFSVLIRKHHCRRDGKVYCDACTTHRVNLPSHKNPERVCDSCYSDVIGFQVPISSPDPFSSN
ncbi:FYVE and coiled-coil domain-containing protein 1 [Entomophthora muscae]|uniref:FYVE and coiled-coil domain-containing protein 1 n=1 Tax=Entomophthora muscae TaxID=34485 RepID=A0ACC2S593_9FUNG|nr:FYVE and coiled-coil domain-containing protein 1 [Entomophthora muscae]